MEADSQGDSRLHLQVKNTFLDFQTDEEFQRRTSHTRSKSWDGSTSSSSVCSGTGDSENEHYYGANVQSRQELHHWVVQTNSSNSASVSDSVDETAGQSFRDFVWELETGQTSPPHPAEAAVEFESDDFQPEYGQSIGSKGHGRGKCTPCTRILVRPGCEYGSRCMFCHLEHSSQMDNKKNRHRPCKAARQQYKQTIQKIYEEYKDKPEQKQKALGKIADASPYMRSLLKGLDGKEEDEIEEPKKIKAASAPEMPRVPGLQPAGSASSSSVVKDRKTLISL
ncbi:unnamed protein product [Cladocopium goreaui]|uniref:C3H1-type domain-containing protein n=1 Tax=Cladocopium goreaui TaxID=2562237 RepID=A0A9P1M5N0_9DINO|nr:unnamed protein product [Cladocopium goreaui]